MILPLDFSEILNIVEITAYFIFYLILWCDIIKFLITKQKSERVYLIPYDRLSMGLEITIVLNLYRKFSLIIKNEEKYCNSENIEDFRRVQRQIYCEIVKVSLKRSVQRNRSYPPF